MRWEPPQIRTRLKYQHVEGAFVVFGASVDFHRFFRARLGELRRKRLRDLLLLVSLAKGKACAENYGPGWRGATLQSLRSNKSVIDSNSRTQSKR